jgi:hypothetical protein
MKRAVLLLVGVVMLVATSSGCCCWQRLWCHHWGMCPWGGCHSGACDDGCSGGGCDSCGGHGGCDNCGPHGPEGLLGHHLHKPHHHLGRGFGTQQYAGPSGPPTGAVAYPYYTNRGPRDFLASNPPSIGP